MGTHITSNMAEEATLRYTPNNWDLAGSLTGIYGVVKKAGEHLATVSRWLGEKSVVQEKMSALGLGASALGFGLMAKSGLEALERKLGLMGSKEGDPTSFQDTNTLIQTLLMGVNLVRKSKQAQFLSLVVGSGLDLWDIFSNWGEAPSGQNWMRLGMFAFFNTGSHNQARLSEAAEESATYAAHVASRIKPQHLAGGLGMLASNEAWASVGGHAFPHPVLWGGGVLAGAAVAVGRRFKPQDYADFLKRYYDLVFKKIPGALSCNPESFPLRIIASVEVRHRLIAKMFGLSSLPTISKTVDLQSLGKILTRVRHLYLERGLTLPQIGNEIGLNKEAARLLLSGRQDGTSRVIPRLGHLVGMDRLADFVPGTILGTYLGYQDLPSPLGSNPGAKEWSDGFARVLNWRRELGRVAFYDVASSMSTLRVSYIHNGGGQIPPSSIWDYEEALGDSYNTALSVLLVDPSVIKGTRPELDDDGLREIIVKLIKYYSLEKKGVIAAMGSNAQTFHRLVSGHNVNNGKSGARPNYNINNVGMLESGLRISIAKALWLSERTKMIEKNRDTFIEAAKKELKPRPFSRQRDQLKDSAKRQINEAKIELEQVDPDDLVTQYQDQLPPVGFLMRYAFGVGDFQV